MSAPVYELTTALEAAEGPSGEIDRSLAKLVGWFRVEPRFTSNRKGGWIAPEDFIGSREDGSPILDSLQGTEIHREVPAYTASMDAAISLVERLLPGFGASIERHPVYGDWWDAAVFDQMPKTVSNARKQTAALAMCLALIRARASLTKEQTDGE